MSEMPVLLKIIAVLLFVAIIFVVVNAARRGHARRMTPRRRFGGDARGASDAPSLWVVGGGDGVSHKHHPGHHGSGSHHHHGDGGSGGHQGSHGGHSTGGFDGGHSGGGFDGGGHAGGGGH